MLTMIRYAALGVIGFLTPRILVGLGVPLDAWGISLGEWLGLSMPWLQEWGLTLAGLTIALILTGIEAWWGPFKRVWGKVFARPTETDADKIRAQAELTKQIRLKEKIDLVRGRLDQVREELRGGASNRRIRMTVGETGPYFDTEGGVYDIRRTFNLKLENTDRSKSVSNCSVQILSVTPPTDYEGPWRLGERLELASGDYVFIPLVTYGEAREPDKGTRGDTFITMGTENGRPHLDVGEKYTVALRATAPETSFCEFQCKVWVDENGRLRIEGN